MLPSILQNNSNARRIILASGSPRRKQILENAGFVIEVVPSSFEENLDKNKIPSPQDYVLETARFKLEEVASRLKDCKPLPDLIIGADTVVCHDSRIIEKPKDKEEAISNLSSLSGRSHHVYTGVVLAFPADSKMTLLDGKPMADGLFHYVSFVESTEVFMTNMTKQVIEAYVETGEAMDKAGGYGTQKIGGVLIEKIHGDFFNIMGFPLSRFTRELASIWDDTKGSHQ